MLLFKTEDLAGDGLKMLTGFDLREPSRTVFPKINLEEERIMKKAKSINVAEIQH